LNIFTLSFYLNIFTLTFNYATSDLIFTFLHLFVCNLLYIHYYPLIRIHFVSIILKMQLSELVYYKPDLIIISLKI